MITPLFEEEYMKLNPGQRKAVDATLGPVMVVAGPGTGKTQVLALRVVNILRDRAVSPHNILCLTFTENGAINMRERLHKFIKQDAYRVGIYTFHAFCNSVISRYPEYFYKAATYTQASDLDRAAVIESIFAALPHKHPLASFHPEKGYVYLHDTLDRIKHIKSGGYTPDEYIAILAVLKKDYKAIEKILAGWPEGRASIKKIAELHPIQEALSALGSTTGIFLAKTLVFAVNDAVARGNMEPITEWKKKYTVKEEETILLKDAYNFEKIEAVGEIYRAYATALHERGLYDYDDMIIEVAHALAENSVLRNELEEQYQYILIDEFQDTNVAQMNLVHAITSSHIHEGRPNVMVVGDDDQAIYKFQGAEISNIVEFRDKTFRDVQTIVLDTNYRSHQEILDYARGIVTQGENRLEKHYKDITKILSQGNLETPKGKLEVAYHHSDIEEYATIAKTVRALLDGKDETGKGVKTNAEDIALLGRNHRELKALLPYLDQLEIPYEYIKKANVFDEPHIKELVTICDYIGSVSSGAERKDFLLPSILSYPYFALPRTVIFDIAIKAKEGHHSWAEVIQSYDNEAVQKLHLLLAELSTDMETTPLEHILEVFMQKSGFKAHYFGKEVMKEHPGTYIHFLASLKTFIEGLREWREGEALFVGDVAPFVAMHREHDITLVSESPFMKAEHAVQIMTVHAAKGLEFGTVFIIAAHDELWTKGSRTNKAPLPSPLIPLLTPAGDTEDDFIRLLYVAITRAKHSLYISGHKPLVRYINTGAREEAKQRDTEVDISAHENALAIVGAPYKEDEWAILKRLVKDYRMSVTHLNNFVNIIEGGPLYFIEQNLLRFPQPKNVAGVFGSAVDKAITEYVMYPKYNAGEKPELKHVLSIFSRELAKGRLTQHEFKKQPKRGIDVLTKYYAKRKNFFLTTDEVQVDMKSEGVVVGEALLSGKLDFLRMTDNKYHVVDFKTGRSYEEWDGPKQTGVDKVKLHKYRHQLVYYKVLLENSVHYKLPVETLALEFVESILDADEPILLYYMPTEEDVSRMKKLIEAVYKKIVNLDFPDISAYEQNIKGILQFEEDLIQGHISNIDKI
jgi:DNA helicase-2/ATP-dependent DNA helicase PcrA